MTRGNRIIDLVSGGRLIEGECLKCKSHDIVLTWSSSAPEQLEAEVAKMPKDYADLLFSVDRYLESLTDDEKLDDGAMLLQFCYKMLKELP